MEELIAKYPETFDCQILDVTEAPAIHRLVENAFHRHDRIDVVVSNAGYGLFGCAEELSDEEIDHIIATNLTGSIMLIRDSLPYLRAQGGGRIIQMSTYGGQVAFPANSMYHATKFGIEGFCEAVAQEVAQFGIGLTLVEPGGARTEFRYGSAKVAKLMTEYESCHGFLNMLDASKELQKELLQLANAKKDYESIAVKSDRLREEKQSIMVEDAEREDTRQHVQEMMAYLREQPVEVIEYDEQLVRRLVEKIMVFDEKFVVEFKAGISLDTRR